MSLNVKLPEETKRKGTVALTEAPVAAEPTAENPAVDTPSPKSIKPVRLDFSKKGSASPFQKAVSVEKRLKLFLWGDSGVGKTTLALQFPKPVVIDMEGGADLYGDDFKFDVLKAVTADQVADAVDWLRENSHDYRTLILDPVTVYWDALQRKWSDIFLLRNRSSKGYRFEFYDLQPKDWMTLKSEFKELIRKLIALDMNVILTARQKTQYKEGSFMVAMGETFDGEKTLPYLFDTIVRLFVDEKGRHMGTCLKDRSNKLPKEPFEAKYPAFESLFGKQTLTRKSKPVALATSEQKAKIESYIEQVGMAADQVAERLSAYGAENIDQLTAQNAEIILQKLEAAVAAQESTGGQTHA